MAVPVVEYVDSATAKSSSNVSNPTINKPSLAQHNDLLIAWYCSRSTTNFTPPTGWNFIAELDADAGPGGTCTASACWRIFQTGDPASWNGTVDTARAYGTGCSAYRYTDLVVPYTSFDTDFGTTTSPNFPDQFVARNGSLLVAGCSVVATSTTEPGTTTERWDLGSGSGNNAAGDGWTKSVNQGQTGALTGAIAGGSAWATIALVLQPLDLWSQGSNAPMVMG